MGSPRLLHLGSAALAGVVPSAAAGAGRPMPAGLAILIFVGGPILVLLIITALVSLPSLAAQGTRYRTGMGWWYDPQWFHGPGELAVPPERVSQVPAIETDEFAGGGASARW